MSNQQHPVTPPPELVEQWCANRGVHNSADQLWRYIATQAAQWGADQELEACCRWIEDQLCMPPDARADVITQLDAARRPKPPSLKEQALKALLEADGADHPVPVLVLPIEDAVVIRRALEALPND